MPTTFCVTEKIVESINSPRLTSAGINTTMTRHYEINAAGHGAALALLKATVLPYPTVDGVLLNATPTLRIEPMINNSGGVGTYKGSVEYRHPGRDEQTTSSNELLEPGREKISASFTGETIHTNYAIWQTRLGETKRRLNYAVNVQSNGEVEGVDVYKPTGGFTISTLIAEDVVTNDWLKDRFRQIWTVNADTFRSWPRGDVALTGMDIRQRSDGNWEVDYSFQIAPGQTGVEEIAGFDVRNPAPEPENPEDPPGDPTAIDIEGWEYVWVMYQPVDDEPDPGEDKVIIPEAIGVYRAQLYHYSDFSQLGVQT